MNSRSSSTGLVACLPACVRERAKGAKTQGAQGSRLKGTSNPAAAAANRPPAPPPRSSPCELDSLLPARPLTQPVTRSRRLAGHQKCEDERRFRSDAVLINHDAKQHRRGGTQHSSLGIPRSIRRLSVGSSYSPQYTTAIPRRAWTSISAPSTPRWPA